MKTRYNPKMTDKDWDFAYDVGGSLARLGMISISQALILGLIAVGIAYEVGKRSPWREPTT